LEDLFLNNLKTVICNTLKKIKSYWDWFRSKWSLPVCILCSSLITAYSILYPKMWKYWNIWISSSVTFCSPVLWQS